MNLESHKSFTAKSEILNKAYEDPRLNAIFNYVFVKAMLSGKHDDSEWFVKEFNRQSKKLHRGLKQKHKAKIIRIRTNEAFRLERQEKGLPKLQKRGPRAYGRTATL